MGFGELSRRLQLLINSKLADIISRILDRHSLVLVELQKDQLYAGLNSKGDRLSPTYLNDPYFKSPLSALRYATYKEKLNQRMHNSLFPKKDFEVPNLIVTGTLVYDTIFSNVSSKQLVISAKSSIINKIESKYNEPFGLSQVAWDYFTQKYLIPDLERELKKFLTQS